MAQFGIICKYFPEDTEKKNMVVFRWDNHCPSGTMLFKVQHWFWYCNINKTSDILFTQKHVPYVILVQPTTSAETIQFPTTAGNVFL